MSNDLVERLRDAAEPEKPVPSKRSAQILHEAADEIERLRAGLREAHDLIATLEPFVEDETYTGRDLKALARRLLGEEK